MKTNKILLVTDYGDKIGGAEKSFLRLVEGMLNDKSVEPLCLFFGKGALYETISRKGVLTFHCHVSYMRRPFKLIEVCGYVFSMIRFLICVARIRLKYGVKLLYCNKTVCLPYGFIATWLFKMKCIWHVRNPNKNFGKLGHFIVNRMYKVIFNSHFTALNFKTQFGERNYFRVVHNGTEIPDTREIKYPETIRKVGMIAHLSVWKNHALFIQAIPRLLELNQNLEFYIIGDVLSANPDENAAKQIYKTELEALIHKLGIADKVSFSGYESNVQKMYHSLDILVHPTEEEPFGLVIIEAMSYGIPVIASDSGGPREIIKHRETGMLFERGNLDSLVECVNCMIRENALRGRIIKQAINEVSRLYSSERYNKEMIEIFNGALSSGRSKT